MDQSETLRQRGADAQLRFLAERAEDALDRSAAGRVLAERTKKLPEEARAKLLRPIPR